MVRFSPNLECVARRLRCLKFEKVGIPRERHRVDSRPIAATRGTEVTSWDRRLSSAHNRQTAQSQYSPALDEAPVDLAAQGLSGEQVRSILTDTMVVTPDMVAVFASIGRDLLWANEAFVTLVPQDQVDDIWLVKLLDEWSSGHFQVKVLPALVKFGRWRGRLTFVTDDGPVPVSAVVVAHRDANGDIETVSVVARDLAELRIAQDDVTATEARFAAMIDNAADLIAVVDADGAIGYISPAACRILGQSADQLNGASLMSLLHPDDRPNDVLRLVRPGEDGMNAPVELRLRSHDGSWRYLEVIATDLRENPTVGGVVLNASDVTERVETALALANRAFTDTLTGLPNRARLLDRLGWALQDPLQAPVLLIVADVDHFKPFNAVAGPGAGDVVLKVVAERLKSVVGDNATLARLGGDEFAIVVTEVADVSTTAEFADRIRNSVRAPIEVAGQAVALTMSVGMALGGANLGPENMVQSAENAMAQAKRDGGNRVEVFDQGMAEATVRRDIVKRQLDHALDHTGLSVRYQPIVDIASMKVVGGEALLRVEGDSRHLLSPAEFIDAAESSGLISRLGLQVLQISVDQLANWARLADNGLVHGLSVNVSPRQLGDPEFSDQVQRVLEHAGVSPGLVCFELSENMLIGPHPSLDGVVSDLQALGIRIGIDDFGNGQSSFGYLKRFPLDFVKIDRSLVAGIDSHAADTAIIRATIELAHNLGLVVAAVGVETASQLNALAAMGCDRAQGYYFAAALSAEEFIGHILQPSI